MNRALLAGLVACVAGAAAPVAASATVIPHCTNTGVQLEWTGFGPGRHDITYSIDGYVNPVSARVENGDITDVTIWTDTPWLRITVRERWGNGPADSLTMETVSNCVGNPPEPPVVTTPVEPSPPSPPVVPPTAPEPPVTPVLPPRPDPVCPAALRNVYRTGASVKWVRIAVARGCVKPRRPKVCPRGYSRRAVRAGGRRVVVCVPPRRPVIAVTG